MFDEGDMTDFQSATLGFSFTDDDYEDESFDDFEDDEISDSLDDFDDDFYEEESFVINPITVVLILRISSEKSLKSMILEPVTR